jgi:hypothetical protein
VNGTVHALEKVAFFDGYYKAFGFGAYPCIPEGPGAPRSTPPRNASAGMRT